MKKHLPNPNIRTFVNTAEFLGIKYKYFTYY